MELISQGAFVFALICIAALFALFFMWLWKAAKHEITHTIRHMRVYIGEYKWVSLKMNEETKDFCEPTLNVIRSDGKHDEINFIQEVGPSVYTYSILSYRNGFVVVDIIDKSE